MVFNYRVVHGSEGPKSTAQSSRQTSTTLVRKDSKRKPCSLCCETTGRRQRPVGAFCERERGWDWREGPEGLQGPRGALGAGAVPHKRALRAVTQCLMGITRTR